MSTSPTTFKRLPVGSRFKTVMASFRKTSKRGAYLLDERGRGKTHAEVRFSRSAAVETLQRD